MKAVAAGFWGLLKAVRRDHMLLAACSAPVLAGVAFRFGVPALETLLTRWAGTATPLLAAADRTRSGACAHAASGMPPIAKCGRPCAMCASTSTTVPSRPDSATERVRPRP